MKLDQIHLEAKLFKGFADQSRLLILSALSSDGSKTVTEIVTKTKLSQPNVSAHLACLFECGLIKKARKGREIFYEINSQEVLEIIRIAKKILKKNSKEIFRCTNY
ncbi:MAG: helix-turn-helix transcriptional regulator [Crocinitomicaceae bacterium]|jgi:DNA-binding transcriptional ArsR family regulator|nr:helix-turn-helix transcriptional regulator [Crocinitomicaceae bacterium]